MCWVIFYWYVLQAIKLETKTTLTRYLAIVATDVSEGREEIVILGFHCTDSSASLGMVLPIDQATEVTLDGDGYVLFLDGDDSALLLSTYFSSF